MSAPRLNTRLAGGIWDKLGNRYESLWTVEALMRVLGGDVLELVVEPHGDEGQGVEFYTVAADGTREYFSAKRQKTGKSALPKGRARRAPGQCHRQSGLVHLRALDGPGNVCLPGMGHLHIDNNPVKRGIRPTTLGRKNWLFLGSPDAGWRTAVIYSIIGSCLLAKVNPYEYIVWALERLACSTSANVGVVTPMALKLLKEQP